MKRSIYEILGTLCAGVALMLVSCNADEPLPLIEEGAVVYPTLNIGVSTMEMAAVSRASAPMSPDMEKYVKTIAVFEFDKEGLHDKGDHTYHFIDFINGTVDGVTGVGDVDSTEYGIVETTLNGLSFEAREEGTICLVANVTQADVDTLYEKFHDTGQSATRLTLTNFKKWSLKFKYVESTSEVYDESTTGHLEEMYMFGYYYGPIVPAEAGQISVDLGRLASRLDITITNDTGEALEKRFGYHFDNVCEYAYFFPIMSSMPPTIHAGLARTVVCAGDEPVEGDNEEYEIVPRTFPDKGVHTRYYYVAAHSADSLSNATTLHLFYDRRIVDDVAGDYSNSVTVPLCNVHPDHAAGVKNGYSLSRNTRYHFTIHLKKRAAAPAAKLRTAAPGAMITDYGPEPGDITIYLPD